MNIERARSFKRPGTAVTKLKGRTPQAVLVYLCLVVPITILLNLAFVNFHAPDDFDHAKRAYTLFHEPFLSLTPRGRSTGAMIDSGLDQYIRGQLPVVMHGNPHSDEGRLAYQRNQDVAWQGSRTFSEMPTAVTYFPLLYAPQAIVLEAGRISGATVAHSVLWARFANGFIAIALAAVGLYLLPGGRSLALLLLLLPRTLLQFASNSADPILYGLALIIVALSIRATEIKGVRSIAMATAIFISAAVRPPIAALALPGAVEAARRKRWLTLAMITSACALAALWVVSVIDGITDHRCASNGSVFPRIAGFALHWPVLVGQTVEQRAPYLYASFIGHYGWGDALGGQIPTPLPMWMYLTAPALLGFALWQDLVARMSLNPVMRLSLAAGAACSLLLTFFAMYVACTVTTQPIIAGVQGRYFVPALFALAAAVAGLAKGGPSYPRAYLAGLSLWVLACASTMIADAYRFYPHS